jgi:hypothetical protein
VVHFKYDLNINQNITFWDATNGRNELIDNFFFSKISVKDIFVYCLQNDGNSLHNVTVS